MKFARQTRVSCAAPEAPVSITVEQQQWLWRVLPGVLRQARGRLASEINGPVPEPELLAQLADCGLELAPLSVAKWLDDAKTHPEAQVLVSGADGLTLLLGRKARQVLVLDPGAMQPRLIPQEELVPRLKTARLYLLEHDEKDAAESYGWRWFLRAFFSRRKVIRDVLVASFVIQLIALAFPLATQVIVDKVITNQAVSTLVAVGVGIALFAVFNALMSWLRQKLLLRLANVVDGDLSSRVMAHLFRLPLRYFEARPTGVLITRAHGVERVREFASGAFLLLALELPFMFVFLALMFAYSALLTGIVLGFVALMVGLSLACGPHLRTLANRQFEASAKVQGFLTERVAAHETVKSLQLENASVSRFGELNRKQLDASLAMRELSNGYGTFMQFFEQLMSASVLVVGAYLAMTSTSLTIGMLVAMQMFAQRVSQPLLKLSGLWQELQQVRTAVTQLGDVMSTAPEAYGNAPTSAGRVRGRLEAQGLGFRHGPDRPLLYSGLNFTIEPGQVALVTGASGSGKSTLAKILLGLYSGHEGFLRIDGRDTRSMWVNELRNVFGVVPQETVLFAGTVAENVLAGSSASFEMAVQACRLAGIHEVIENLPEGYQTKVGERGTGLSGGQRQRIGIARALIKRPAVLVFDEATSGLDEESAEHIAKTVNFLRGKATVLFIAHKVPRSLVVDCHVSLSVKSAEDKL